MSFKPYRGSRPMNERPMSVQTKAAFFKRIQPLLTKRQQGKVMGAYRATIEEFLNPVRNTKISILMVISVTPYSEESTTVELKRAAASE